MVANRNQVTLNISVEQNYSFSTDKRVLKSLKIYTATMFNSGSHVTSIKIYGHKSQLQDNIMNAASYI